MRQDYKIAVIIPVLNEESTIGTVLQALPSWVDISLVADNGSTDNSTSIAQENGATVVSETRRGYGAACLRAMKEIADLETPPDGIVVVFLDGDFSDDPSEMHLLVDPIVRGEVDFVLGSRVLGPCEKGALTSTQRFGSWLSSALLRVLFDHRCTDLGPFRAIRFDALQQLEMDDLDFGWTVQMQARAARAKLRILEVPVSYRNRAGGQSKVSGTIKGVYGAGTTILRVIYKEYIRPSNNAPLDCCSTQTLITFGKRVLQWLRT